MIYSSKNDYAYVFDCISPAIFIITGNALFEMTAFDRKQSGFSRKDGFNRTRLKVIDQYNH